MEANKSFLASILIRGDFHPLFILKHLTFSIKTFVLVLGLNMALRITE
jgi:hypothetical protein